MTSDLDIDLQDNDVVPVENAPENASEKVFDNATVQKIVERERLKAYEKAKRDLQMQQMEEAQNQNAPTNQQSGLSPDEVGRLISEQLPQHMQNHIQQEQKKQAISSFVTKIEAAEERHPGLEAKLNDLDYDTMAPVVMLANNMENTADIMAELVDHPMKMANLLTLMYTQPKLAQREMSNLSNSIKQNQAALAQQQEESNQKPIGQTKPSMSSGKNVHDMSLDEIRRAIRDY